MRNRRMGTKKSASRRRLKMLFIKLVVAGMLFIITVGIHNFSPKGKALVDSILSISTDLYAIQNSAIEFIRTYSN